MRSMLATCAVLAVSVAFLGASDRSHADDAAAIMRDVIASEQWIHDVESFFIRYESVWTTTPQGFEARRAALREQYPQLEEITVEQFKSLRTLKTDALTIAFSSDRIYYRWEIDEDSCDLRIWDGLLASAFSGESFETLRSAGLRSDTREMFDNVASQLAWLQASSRPLWWNQRDAAPRYEFRWGPLEEVRLSGFEVVDGARCHVIDANEGFFRFWVGVDDRLTRQVEIRVLIENNSASKVIQGIGARRGVEFPTRHAYHEWKASQSEEERRVIEREYNLALLPESRPQIRYSLGEYVEIAPGRWLPTRQGYDHFLDDPDEKGEYVVSSSRVMRAVEVRIDEPLPDELFESPLKDGMRVVDFRYDPFLVYTHESDMPDEKWETIVAEAQRRHTGRHQELDEQQSLAGTPAPPFPETTWINSEPLTWEDLRGRVVILDFFAEWCGPCRSYYPIAAGFHRDQDKHGIVVIGIHNPGSEMDRIQQMLRDYKMEFPICIDVPRSADEPQSWGLLTKQYAVRGIPRAVVVDREGKIAGHGSLTEMIDLARGM